MNSKEKLIIKIIISVNAVILFAAFSIIGVFPFYPGSYYSFTLPFLLQCMACIILSVFLLSRYSMNAFLKTALSILMICMYFSFSYAMNNWPGGDDGPGLAWYYVIGFGTFLSMFLGLMYLIHIMFEAFYEN